MTERIIAFVSSWDPFWAVFFLSMLPITELRASVPIGIAWGLTPFQAFFSALIGNIIPIPFLLLLLGPFLNFLRRFSFLDFIVKALLERSLKNKKTIERYGVAGLAIFVGIPLPGTGVWSGSLLSYFLTLPFQKSFLAMVLGVIIADLIVTLLSLGFFQFLSIVSWPWFLVIVILIFLSYLFYRRRKNKKSSAGGF